MELILPKRLLINPNEATFSDLAPAARVLLDGGIVAGPTESFYALMALVDDSCALEKIVSLKGEEGRQNKASLIMLDQAARALSYAREIPEEAQGLIEHFWPGALTLLFLAQSGLHHTLVGPARTVGLRVEGLAMVRSLVRMVDRGLSGTSANPAGAPAAATAEAVLDYFGDSIDLIIDGGVTQGGPASTIIDASLGSPRMVRDGGLPTAKLMAACPILRL
ncbi:MAG: L-threonylcarbamoyladenylate synthase [Candidatus Adiutrix sp.]